MKLRHLTDDNPIDLWQIRVDTPGHHFEINFDRNRDTQRDCVRATYRWMQDGLLTFRQLIDTVKLIQRVYRAE
jgi:hypothetical protein